MAQGVTILDAATRFLRSNPELLDLARRGAGETGVAVEVLLADAVRRIRRSGFEAVSKEEVIARAAHRREGGIAKRLRVRGPAVDDPRPRLIVLASGDSRRDGQKQLVNRTSA
jgi:hypothetical protein